MTKNQLDQKMDIIHDAVEELYREGLFVKVDWLQNPATMSEELFGYEISVIDQSPEGDVVQTSKYEYRLKI